MFLVSGQTGDFGTWLDNQQNNASCDLSKAKFKQACQCDPIDKTEAEKIKNNAGNCGWTSGNGELTCREVCP